MPRGKTAAKRKPAAVRKSVRGRKPNQYVVVLDRDLVDGPFSTTELLGRLADMDEADFEAAKVFKLDHEVTFKRVPARVEIQNGSA